MAGNGKVAALRGISLFAGLKEAELQQIAQLADEVDLPAGHVLMRQGASGAEAFILVEGEAEVDRDGRHIKTLGPGSVIGEMALISESSRMATATLSEPSRLLVLGHREFHSLMDAAPAVRACVLDDLARRIGELELDKAH